MLGKIKKNKTIENILWLLLDKLLIIILQFFVGVKIANYYGVKEYGIYSYAVAILSFSPILLELTNDRIVKKYFDQERYVEVISTINIFKGIVTTFILILIIFSKMIYKIEIQLYIILILLSIDNILMNCTDGIKSYFEYNLDSKIVVKIDSKIKIVYYLIQYIAIQYNFSLYIIIIIRICGSFYRWVLLLKNYENKYQNKIYLKLNIKILKIIIKESKYLWFAMISYILYAQLDKIMIGKMMNLNEVGIYNIAFQMMSILLVPIEAIRISFYPILWEKFKKDYLDYINEYNRLTLYLTQFYILITILSYVLVPKLFFLVYSEQYEGAILIFNNLLLGIIIRGNETFQYTHYTFKEITRFILYKQICGLIINIILNFFLIKKYGAAGAALATSITLLFTRLYFDLFFNKTREVFIIQIKAYNTLNLFRRIK